jgi:hypothetical protein
MRQGGQFSVSQRGQISCRLTIVTTLGIRLSLLHIRLVLCSPVPSVVGLGCNSFCRCLSLVGHPTG